MKLVDKLHKEQELPHFKIKLFFILLFLIDYHKKIKYSVKNKKPFFKHKIFLFYFLFKSIMELIRTLSYLECFLINLSINNFQSFSNDCKYFFFNSSEIIEDSILFLQIIFKSSKLNSPATVAIKKS